jgi:hypothetical protein
MHPRQREPAADHSRQKRTMKVMAGGTQDVPLGFFPGEGHLVFIQHWREILKQLTSQIEAV